MLFKHFDATPDMKSANAFLKPADTLESEKQKARRDCLATLFLTEPYVDRAMLISTKGQRVESTCEWIRDNDLYHSWMDSRSQLLWISGGLGKGKTIISIFIT